MLVIKDDGTVGELKSDMDTDKMSLTKREQICKKK